MTGSRSHTGTGAGEAIRKGVGLVHGTGEALRGNFNAAVDGVAGDRAGVHKNEAIAARGTDEMDHGYHHDRGTGAGVTPLDTSAERQHRNIQGEYTHGTGSTNHGPHTTNIGNNIGPGVNSDLDGRGVRPGYDNPTYVHYKPLEIHDGSSNLGADSETNDNRPDTWVGSNPNHRDADNTQFYKSHTPPGSSIHYTYHDGYVVSMIDPRIDSRCGHCIGSSDMRPDGPRNTTPHRLAPPLRRKSEPLQYYVTDVNPEKTPTASQQLQWRPLPLLLPPDPYIYYPSHHPYNYEYLHGIPYPYEDSNSSSYMAQRADVPNWRAKAEHQAQSQHAPHSNRMMNVLDPRTPMLAPKGSPHSTEYPHKSGWLNLLDPRVDRKAIRKDRGRSD